MSARIALALAIGMACAACDEWHVLEAMHAQETTAAGLDELRAIGCAAPRVFAPGPMTARGGDAGGDAAIIACASPTLTCDDVAAAWAKNPQRRGDHVHVEVAVKPRGRRSCNGEYDHDGRARSPARVYVR